MIKLEFIFIKLLYNRNLSHYLRSLLLERSELNSINNKYIEIYNIIDAYNYFLS